MILTVTNLSASPVEIGYPINRTLDESGGAVDSVALGVSEADLQHGNAQGKPAFKELDLLAQKGVISMSLANDAQASSITASSTE